MDGSNYANNDDFDPWTSIGLQTAMLLNRLRIQAQLLELQTDEKQNEQSGSDPNAGNADEQRAEDQRRYVDQPLQKIPAFELKRKGVKI
jgi:hypothetical protein